MTEAGALLDDVTRSPELPHDRQALSLAEACARVTSAPGPHHFVGAEGSASSLLAVELALRSARPVLVVTPDIETARRAVADAHFLLHRRAPEAPAPLLVTPSEVNPYAEVHPERTTSMNRAAVLFHLAKDLPWRVAVTSTVGMIRKVPAKDVLCAGGRQLVAGEELDLEKLEGDLSRAGYLRTPVVEDPGCFAVRGGLLDVWPAGAKDPVRIELYGDLVLEMRSFDPENQRTAETLMSVWVPPARESILSEEARARAEQVMRSLADAVNYPSTKTRKLVEDIVSGRTFFGGEGYLPAYSQLVPLVALLPEKTLLVFDNPQAVVKSRHLELESAAAGAAARAQSPHFPTEALYASDRELDAWIDETPTVSLHRVGVSGKALRGFSGIEVAPVDAPTLAMQDHSDLERAVKATKASHGKENALDPLMRRLTAWREIGLEVTLVARTETQADRLAALLGHRNVRIATDEKDGTNPVRLVVGSLARGVVALVEGWVLLTEEEIFGHRAHRSPKRKRSPRALLEDLRALVPGDFVVHVEHGIGRYAGLERKQVGEASVDLLTVEYAGGDKLFVPVHRLNQIQKYSGGDGSPRLDRLGGQTFAKTKARVRRRVREMADELLRLYAERQKIVKDPLAPPDDEYAELEATFPFEETPDQAAAIADVLKDLESEQVMDRLVCGDVGFGKTEVAVRAAFRYAMAGRQTALLCPTTVLAQQHYLTFARRFEDHPIEVRALSRFQSKQQQSETVQGLRKGSVDVVVGTHRLLSKDVHFANLGLVIVDEEQRFGVAHKERLKQLRTSVDVLTLTATPIPRTMQLAVGGLRDMSVITTPPVDRRAIRTIVSQFDEQLVREAIERERSRGGQVFYVYNRVEGIYERAARLQALIPNARIVVGHGQLKETLLEKTMLDFVDGKYDVLVATAIIESGLDIPRANTMIVDRADLFGLAQLYQLRGRVGRSNERAYCYLLVPALSELTDEARYRIEALERYTELGTGFHVATLDMEQRGYGNLLGAEQSGSVASVGFDLFCQMLEEATHELRGEVVVHDVDPELSFDVDALLPEDYIPEVGVRLTLYKRLAGAQDEAEVAAIAEEIQDRFGSPPPEARQLIELMRLKTELRRLRVFACEATSRSATLHLREDTPLDPGKISALVGQGRHRYRLTPDMRLTRRADADVNESSLRLVDRMLGELADATRP